MSGFSMLHAEVSRALLGRCKPTYYFNEGGQIQGIAAIHKEFDLAMSQRRKISPCKIYLCDIRKSSKGP